MLYELAEEAKREISKYSDDYEIYLSSGKVLQLDSQKTDLNKSIAIGFPENRFEFCKGGI